MSRAESTLLSIALAAVLTLAAHTEVILVAAVVLIVQLMIAAAPAPASATGRSVHAPRFAASALAGVIATVITVRPQLLLGADGTTAGDIGSIESGVFAGIAPAIAVGVMASLILQMLRRDGRKSLVLTTGYAVTLCSFSALSIGWIGASQSLGGPAVVAVGASAVAAGLLVWLIPLGRWIVGPAAVIAGGVAGAVVTGFVSDAVELTPYFGALTGVGTAMFAILGQVLGRAWCSGRRHASSGWAFPGALSLALSAPIIFVSSQLLGATFSLS